MPDSWQQLSQKYFNQLVAEGMLKGDASRRAASMADAELAGRDPFGSTGAGRFGRPGKTVGPSLVPPKRDPNMGMIGGPYTGPLENPVTGWVPGTGGSIVADPTFNQPGSTQTLRPQSFTDISDPFGSLLNRMMMTGRRFNPANTQYMRHLQGLAQGGLSQFLAGLLPGGTGGGVAAGQEDIPALYGAFLDQMLGGAVRPWNLSQAQRGIGGLNSLLRDTTERLAQPAGGAGREIDVTDPAAMGSFFNEMALSRKVTDPVMAALGGNLLDPDFQQAMFLGGMMPGLGPGLSQGLGKIVGQQRGAWDRFLQLMLGETPGYEMTNFLDLLTNSLGVGGRPGWGGQR